MCGVDRTLGQFGFCRSGDKASVALFSLHMWEEPCISGEEGSGTVFFTGCSLGCSFCQNHSIASGRGGAEITEEQLSDIFLAQQERGANNINLVTAAHFVPQCAQALRLARERGLAIPVLYNSSGYELPQTLDLLDDLVDIYLPDFKFMDPLLARKYSNAPDYPQRAERALDEMVLLMEKNHPGGAAFDSRGMMTAGVIVRVLLLPGHVKDACSILEYLHAKYGDRIYISIMNQYTPMEAVKDDPDLSRKVTKREYEKLVAHAIAIGIRNGFVQEGDTAEESFIPEFDGRKVLKLWEQTGKTK